MSLWKDGEKKMLKLSSEDIEDVQKLNRTDYCYRPLLIQIKKDDESFLKLDHEVLTDLSDFQIASLLNILTKEVYRRKEEK